MKIRLQICCRPWDITWWEQHYW